MIMSFSRHGHKTKREEAYFCSQPKILQASENSAKLDKSCEVVKMNQMQDKSVKMNM